MIRGDSPVFYNKAPSSVTENKDRYALSDQKLNEIWNKLPSETRRKLLPSQREWIKQKDTCRRDTECLTDMTNKRIKILEVAR
ncbi:lysozyme inhibitor LprI family protein [Klebsiella variicola]|uniref:lysozyme inhibitor LprI family protein n=1 Tax=Klebsiella variicola TaxID=244366 RepID=UPI002F965857